MALLEIVVYPDERLQSESEPVAEVNDQVRKLIDDMAETMYTAPGIGLAANQVGINQRIIVVDVEYSDVAPNLIALINPEITESEGEIVWEEGCLSFPEIREEILRSAHLKAKALNRNGEPFEIEADGLLAVALQHEIDHLNGVLLIDHVSFLKRRMIHRQLVKYKRSR
ncbi:MAG: peptide deformylase [Proteobacteria bacterium]|nr:peptide deformylase [Pseudomonadota bacterium]